MTSVVVVCTMNRQISQVTFGQNIFLKRMLLNLDKILGNVESDVNYQGANVTSFSLLIQIVILGDIHIGIREPW